ncbi:hypothetical protein CVT25_009433 [Psilocybe cyanescens]|uniref:Uncharacterized protein n=1 Tax=Psilocybe cyanescens TaxID=93625 RepID=A0A409XV13_PSICY|nr:hypothetical protein CVT25_009433 [Psilocybe cyanescens]
MATTGSGTATGATLEDIPSIAFSGSSGSTVSHHSHKQPSSSSSKTAKVCADLVLKFTPVLLNNSGAILPKGINLDVNFAWTLSCSSASSYKFVLSSATDVKTCDTNELTVETTAFTKGCIVTVSVFNASTKADVESSTQSVVLGRHNIRDIF